MDAEVSPLQNCLLALMYRRLWLAAEVFQAVFHAVRIQESVGADATVNVTDYVTVSVAANGTVSVSAGVTDDVSTDAVNATVSADVAADNVTAGTVDIPARATVDVHADTSAKVSADVAADNVTAGTVDIPAGVTVDVSAAVVVTANAATDNATANAATANVTAVGTVNAGAGVTVRVCHSSSADVGSDVAQVVAGGLLAAGNGAQLVDRAAVRGQVARVGEPKTSISKTSNQNSQETLRCSTSNNKKSNQKTLLY